MSKERRPLGAFDATTKAERVARRTLQNDAGYVKAVEKAVKGLMKERFLIEEDAVRFIHDAEASSVLR